MAIALTCGGLVLLPTNPAAAQEDYTKDDDYEIGSLFNKSGAAMADQEWKKALFYLDRIISEYEEGSASEFGPKFGVMHYRRGFCLSRDGKFDEAIAAFETCINKYGNKPDTPAEKFNPLIPNAMLECAAVTQRTGDFEGALVWYEKFKDNIKDAEPGSYSPAFLFIEMGTCYVKTGEMEKGLELIDRAFSEPKFRASSKDLFRAFLSLVDGWNEAAANAPVETQKTIHAFIDKYGDKLRPSAYDKSRFSFNPRLVEAARAASENKMHTAALRLYSMVASSSDIVEDLEARAAGFGGANAQLQAAIDEQTASASDPKGLDMVTLFGIANAYQQLGNFRAGFGVYDYLENRFPTSEHRPDILFGALQCASAINADASALYFGEDLLENHPDYEHRDKAIGLMVTKLFFSGQYERALEVSTRMRDTIAPESPQREVVDFVYAGSLFYLQRYDESLPEVTAFIEKYPESPYYETMRRLDSLGPVILQDWAAAGPKLDKFLEDFPESEMTADVLVDRAITHYSLSEYDPTLKVVQILRTEHAASPNLDRALNLAGDVHFSREDNEKAEEAYLKAREASTRHGNEDPNAHAVAQLVNVANLQEKYDDVLAYYEEFFSKHEGNLRESGVAVGSVPALQSKDRMSEAYTTLEKVIARAANSESAAESDALERALTSYCEFYGQEKGGAALDKQLLNFPTHGMPKPPLLKAWLLMSQIDTYEDEAYKGQIEKVDAKKKVAYQELAAFDKSILPPYILVKVGRQLRTLGAPLQATPWFEEVLARGESEHSGLADLGIAQIYASTGDAAKETEAIAKFKEVMTKYPGESYEEEAALGLADLQYQKGQWQNAAASYQVVFANKKWSRDRARVAYNMGDAYEKSGDRKMALASYMNFFGPPYQSVLKYSAPARVKAATLQWDAGKKEDGYTLIQDTATRMWRNRGSEDDKGDDITKAMRLYKEWQAALGKPADEAREEGITWPE